MKEKSDINKAVGNRLSELLEANRMSQADLRRKAKRLSGIEIPSSHVSLICNGKRRLPHAYAEMFSSILKAPLGYLLGDDNFECNTYAEYLEKEKNTSEFKGELEDMSKYDYLINPLGYYVTGALFNKLTPVSYTVEHRKAVALIPAEEMDAFIKDVNEYITMKMKPLMKKYTHSKTNR